jgi:hypothetical protein
MWPSLGPTFPVMANSSYAYLSLLANVPIEVRLRKMLQGLVQFYLWGIPVTWCESSWVDRSSGSAFASSWWVILDSVLWNKCITVFRLKRCINKKKPSNQSLRYAVFPSYLPPLCIIIIIIIIIIIYFNNYNIANSSFRFYFLLSLFVICVFSYVPLLSL